MQSYTIVLIIIIIILLLFLLSCSSNKPQIKVDNIDTFVTSRRGPVRGYPTSRLYRPAGHSITRSYPTSRLTRASREFFDTNNVSERSDMPNNKMIEGVFIPSGTNCLTSLPGKLILSEPNVGPTPLTPLTPVAPVAPFLSSNDNNYLTTYMPKSSSSATTATSYVPTTHTLYAPGQSTNESVIAEHFCNVGLNEPNYIFDKVKPYDHDYVRHSKAKDYNDQMSFKRYELLESQ